MAEVTSVSLGGVKLSLRQGESHSWTIRAGTKPVQRTFVMSTHRAELVLKRARTQFRSLGAAGASNVRQVEGKVGPLVLEMHPPGYRPLIVKGLYVVSAAPVDENRTGVVVVDRRWLWARMHVLRDYNLRRFAGNFRLVGNALSPIQVKDTQPDFIFRRVTLNNGIPWTAKEVLKDVLTQLVGPGQFRIGRLTLFRDIHDMTIDDMGTSAMMRVLAYLPGAQIFVDVNGKVIVYNSLGGAEGSQLNLAGPPHRGPTGDAKEVRLVDLSLVRPRKVISLFTIEPEIRFDYTERDTSGAAAAVTRGREAPLREPRVLENVIPVVDPGERVLGGALTLFIVNGKSVARNTWLPINDWLEAINDIGDFPGGPKGRKVAKASLGPLSQRLIRKHYLSGFQWLRASYVLADLGLADPIWQLRLDAVQQYWRSAFRLLPQWRDKIKSIKAIRASIVDQENGTRGKAEAFFDYTSRPSRRNFARTSKNNPAASWTSPGFPNGFGDISKAAPGPADVVILEAESGTFQLVYRVDPWGDNTLIAPGRLAPGAAPVQSTGDAFLAWNSTKVVLEQAWQMSVILTVELAAPNNQSRLHAHEVTISRALALLPSGGIKSRKALGPDWVMRVGSGIQTARFAWLDASAGAIEEAVFTNKPFPRELLLNRSHIKAIAEANAARVQALLMDRHQGEQIVSFNPRLRPAGSLAQVNHVVMMDQAVTHMILPAIAIAPDLLALLPDSTRKLLQRGVQE